MAGVGLLDRLEDPPRVDELALGLEGVRKVSPLPDPVDTGGRVNVDHKQTVRTRRESLVGQQDGIDIDGVFHGRENVLAKVNTMRDSLTFDCLLNAIGGIETADGTFIVVTTNRPDLLDDALGRPDEVTGTTRPGRLDRAFRLPFPNEEQRSSILRRILGRCGDDDIAITEGMSAAQVTEWAVSMALQGVWGEQPQG